MPLNPRWSAKKLIVSKCRFMSSKKVPLWLVFENADPYGQEIVVMFKSGDDLRQDMLTIQVLSVMDSIWLHNGLDLRMSPYKVLATGVNKDMEGVGMMEIVLDSETINTINTMNGGSLRKETINDYLTHHHKSDQELARARENFARSCAGYCVATFVMGIGDRHSDNIMVKRNGQFFHIDFGHFLGNFKIKKMWGVSIKRERSALVFTPTMKYAIDQNSKSCPLYDQFIEWTGEAYNCLRMRSRLLILLFALMVSAGMPELMSDVDINYLVDMLRLKVDAKKARQHVQSEVKSSLKDWMRILDNRIHEAVHS
jgi:phosphatidylinositol-4,5-bisphosphate 3-kinase